MVIFPKISVGARAHSTVVRKTHTPLFPAEAKITRIPTGASFDEAGLFYQSTYQLNGQIVTVKRVLNVQRPGMVCQPEDHQLIRK